MDSDSPSATMPRSTGSRSQRRRIATDSASSTVVVMRPSGRRTATAQTRGVRIMTPSRTAWPPIGGLPSAPPATRASYPLEARASRRWKRSTRPPVSTSFCLPV